MIIGICGLIGAGKDTAADYLVNLHHFRRESFANTLKDAVSQVFGWDRTMLEGRTKHSREWREQVDVWWAERLNIPELTPRWVLQQWGTNVLRTGFHDDIWIASLENKLRNSKDDIVISDCRFPNELAAIKNAGGITMRTHRGDEPVWLDIAELYNSYTTDVDKQEMKNILEQNYGVHASEYSSVGLDYDWNLDNNGTIDSLHKQIESIING